jgi:DNA-binding response OmpR family regulator
MNGKIIVVESCLTLQATLATNLKRHGYSLGTAEDGKTAVELIRSHIHVRNLRTNTRLVQGVYDYNCDPQHAAGGPRL